MDTSTLAQMPAQRAEGWPNFHPETYCHRCGEPNIVWFAQAEVWNALMRADGFEKPEPFNGIICPVCFGQMWELAFGQRGLWELRRSDT